MPRFDLRELARHGAEHRIRQIREEIGELLRQFPDLDAPRREVRSAYPPNELAALGGAMAPTGARRKRRRSMSPAERRAVGERMRKYWARRKAAAKQRKSA